MKDKLNKPCVECPFRTDSKPGWLGASTAQEFVERANRQSPMECHMTVDYYDPDWKESLDTDKVSYCAGAAQYLVNSVSTPRDDKWRAVVERMRHTVTWRPNGPMFPEVFWWPADFLAHHDNEINKRYVKASEDINRNG